MPTAEEIAAAKKAEQEGQDPPGALTEERVVALVNASMNSAITGHLKRHSAALEKTIADVVGKALAPKPEEPPRPLDGTTAPAASPQLVKITEELDRMKKAHADAEARAKAVEEKARTDAMRATVKEALEAKGIKGVRARAVIADLEQSKALRFDAEGNPRLVVKRSRGKDAPLEEMEWDLREGIDDWSKTPDAQEFLPPPAPPPPRPGAYGQNAPLRRGAPRYDKPAMSEAEALSRTEQTLLSQGVDVASAFRR